MKQKFSLSRGFTLVELMIVIAIIGILAAVLYPSLNGYFERSRDTNRQKALNSYALALSSYNIDYSTYPKNATATTQEKMCAKKLYDDYLKKYMKSFIKDPKNGNGVIVNTVNCASDGGYGYSALRTTEQDTDYGNAYVLGARMEMWSNANFNNGSGTALAGLTVADDAKLVSLIQKGESVLETVEKTNWYYVVTP